jgi:purine-cytosine permease-like protein
MSVDEKVILQSNEVFAIEVRGFDHIPEPERNMTLRHVDHLWVGTSVNLFSFALVVGMAVAALTMKSPLYVGPIATALGGTDLSWILGMPVSALCYSLLRAIGENRTAVADRRANAYEPPA